MGGPLMKRLAYKLGTRPPPMNPVLLSTTLQHRCNSAVGLQWRCTSGRIWLRQWEANEQRVEEQRNH